MLPEVFWTGSTPGHLGQLVDLSPPCAVRRESSDVALSCCVVKPFESWPYSPYCLKVIWRAKNSVPSIQGQIKHMGKSTTNHHQLPSGFINQIQLSFHNLTWLNPIFRLFSMTKFPVLVVRPADLIVVPIPFFDIFCWFHPRLCAVQCQYWALYFSLLNSIISEVAGASLFSLLFSLNAHFLSSILTQFKNTKAEI